MITCELNCNQQLDIIYRGTTPTFNFRVCLDTALIDQQNTHIVFTSGEGKVDKFGEEIMVGGDVLSCSLTQEDTMSFTGSQVNIQVLVTMKNGQKPASVISSLPVSNTLRGGEKW